MATWKENIKLEEADHVDRFDDDILSSRAFMAGGKFGKLRFILKLDRAVLRCIYNQYIGSIFGCNSESVFVNISGMALKSSRSGKHNCSTVDLKEGWIFNCMYTNTYVICVYIYPSYPCWDHQSMLR